MSSGRGSGTGGQGGLSPLVFISEGWVYLKPPNIAQNYILAKVENLTLEMPELAKELKRETFYAIKKFNWTEKQAAAAYNRTIKKLWNELIIRDNCHPFKGSLLIWVQIPMWVIFSTTIRNLVYMLPDRDMASKIISLELSVGGALWFPNLTVPDASLILPVTMGLVNLAIVEVQTLSRSKKPTKLQRYATNLFRGLSVAMIPIAAGVPSTRQVSWINHTNTYFPRSGPELQEFHFGVEQNLDSV
uniref:Mitochondrial inner membrane protein COX18 n=1 Tax=Timema tahoe TaxID=61484 RepID=A0A7R9IEN7_9NEOP|nr:unnamed protein product [Timema tahoe]